jgi:hypothetical protein
MVVIFHKEDEHCISLRICEVCVLGNFESHRVRVIYQSKNNV